MKLPKSLLHIARRVSDLQVQHGGLGQARDKQARQGTVPPSNTPTHVVMMGRMATTTPPAIASAPVWCSQWNFALQDGRGAPYNRQCTPCRAAQASSGGWVAQRDSPERAERHCH